MEIRNGKCFDCGAEYKIPASFPHDVARCKECGKAVQIAKLGEPMPTPPAPPAPAKRVSPKAPTSTPLEEYVPSGKKAGEPSMMERLRAERAAAKGGKSSSTSTPEKSGARQSGSGRKASPGKVAAGSVAKAAGSSRPTQKTPRKSSAARKTGGSASKRRNTKDAGDGRKRSERGPRQKEKKSPMLGIAALALLLAGAAVFLMKDKLFGNSDSVEAGTTDVAAAQDVDAANSESADASSEEATPDFKDATQGDEEGSTPETEPETSGETSAADAVDAESEPAKPTAPPDEGPDTTLLVDVGPMFGASEEDMQAMDTLMAKWMDPYAGSAGNRSRDKLIQNYGLQALPVMINAMKNLDLSTPEGNSNGDQIQKALQDLFFGKNFDWMYPSTEPDKYLAFDRKVVRNWHVQILKISEQGLEYFIAMTGLEKKKKDSDEYAKPERAKAAVELRKKYGDGASTSTSDEGDEGIDMGLDDDLDID